MKGLQLLAAPLLILLAAEPAVAHGPLGHYNARLSSRDHFNSNGERLRTVAAIIRQDRANFHRFMRHDPQDQWDGYFKNQGNRAALERLIARGTMGPGVSDAIINGEPLIHVDIYHDYVVVTVL